MTHIGWSTIGRTLAVGIVAAAVAVPVAAAAKERPAASAAAITRCYSQDVRVTFVINDGGAGQFYQIFRVTNVAKPTCTLRGYVRALLFNHFGTPLSTTVTHDTNWPEKTITLASGKSTTFYLHFGNPGTVGCPTPPTSHAVTVTMPGATNPDLVHVSENLNPCGGKMTTAPVGGFPFA